MKNLRSLLLLLPLLGPGLLAGDPAVPASGAQPGRLASLFSAGEEKKKDDRKKEDEKKKKKKDGEDGKEEEEEELRHSRPLG